MFGNFLLGQNVFKTGRGFSSVTTKTESLTVDDIWKDCGLTIVDSPGLGDAKEKMTDDHVIRQISEVIELTTDENPGFDALFFVTSMADRFTQDLVRTLEYFSDLGGNFWAYVTVIFSFAKQIRATEEEQRTYVQEHIDDPHGLKPLQTLMENVGGRFIAVESTEKDSDYRQDKLDEVLGHLTQTKDNQPVRYTNTLYDIVQKQHQKQRLENERLLAEIREKQECNEMMLLQKDQQLSKVQAEYRELQRKNSLEIEVMKQEKERIMRDNERELRQMEHEKEKIVKQQEIKCQHLLDEREEAEQCFSLSKRCHVKRTFK